MLVINEQMNEKTKVKTVSITPPVKVKGNHYKSPEGAWAGKIE
jgi:hypothetical protein